MTGEEVLLGSNMPEPDRVSDSPDGEIKRVICQLQRQPEPEVESVKSRFRNWESAKGTEALLDVSRGEKLLDIAEEEPPLKPRLQLTKFVSPMSPRSPSVTSDLLEKNRSLEAALKKSQAENEFLKREHEEEKSNLLEALERLELANEQLLAGGENCGMEQLQMELTRLQKHNTVLSQREQELQFQLSTKDMLQKEVQHLQELNEQLLETQLPAVTESESGNKMLERIESLETELAEALEVNNLYKSQLHTAFAEAKNVQAPVEGSSEEEIFKLREHVKSLEAELQDLRDRYFVMSIRMAEREAQHEEAMMKVRRLQSPIKHFTSSFKW